MKVNILQGIVRLNHLQLSVSHQAILSKMDDMAAGFEVRIQQWKECLVKELLRKCKHALFKSIGTIVIISLFCMNTGGDKESNQCILASEDY